MKKEIFENPIVRKFELNRLFNLFQLNFFDKTCNETVNKFTKDSFAENELTLRNTSLP